MSKVFVTSGGRNKGRANDNDEQAQKALGTVTPQMLEDWDKRSFSGKFQAVRGFE